MEYRPWQLISWTPVRFELSELRKPHLLFPELSVVVRSIDKASGLHSGECVAWGLNTERRLIGIGWEWCEVRRDAFAMSDPMSVASNLQIVEPGDDPCEVDGKTIVLNRMIYELPWTDHVCAAVSPVTQRMAA